MVRISNLTYTYPFQETPALRDVSLRVNPGEAVLLTGASGGGKTTLLRTINGLIPHVHGGCMQGTCYLAGGNMADLSLRDVSRIVSTLFQDPSKQFLALTVADEIGFALEWRESNQHEIARRVEQAIENFGLQHLRRASIYGLSEGEKQKVALASLAVLQPMVMTLDEPTANLDPRASGDLAKHLARLKAAGATLIVADHRLAWLDGLIDRVLVIDNGQVAAEGDWSILEDATLRDRYGLRAVRWPCLHQVARYDHHSEEALVRWEGLTFGYRGRPLLFDDATIAVLPAAVTAMTGVNGSGKTTLARIMAGLVVPRRGRLIMNDEPCRPRDLLARTGMAMQSHELQLFQRTALQELMHAAARRAGRMDPVKAREWLERFGLGDIAARHPQSLSGGQKQRLVVACAAARADELLILDEPTSGLDGAQMRALADVLDRRRRAGRASLVITHDLELIARACTHEIRLPLASGPHVARPEQALAVEETLWTH
jgi:energy-coupling factor transport system ATP-binding protein